MLPRGDGEDAERASDEDLQPPERRCPAALSPEALGDGWGPRWERLDTGYR